MNRRILNALCCSLFLSASSTQAAETAPSECGKSFVVTGEIKHNKKKPQLSVEGATDLEFYQEEILGKNFTATVAGLPEDRYKVVIFLSETFFQEPGKRVIEITSGNQKIAENLDLFATAGFAKEYVIKAEIEHFEDQIGGPLSLTFQAKTGDAKLNAIEILNSKGEVVACVKARDLTSLENAAAFVVPEIAEAPIYFDAQQPVEKRVADLVRRMSLKEKVEQLMNAAPPIARLKVPGYDYWNECLHGVARAGVATVYPQAIGMAATWDTARLQQVADAIATEGRAKNNEARAKNPNTARYFGLTFWTPNINIFRDPRWGRGHETYGEDPFLTARLGVAFIQGLQGDDPRYLKAVACAKHYAVHSGPEKLRHHFNVDPSKRDLWETYLPQFEAAVKEGKVESLMSVYNAIYGIPGPASKFLLTEVLREQWGFQGHVVSDCGAVKDVYLNHKFVKTPEEASALSIKAGNDLECGGTNAALVKAVNAGLVTEKELDRALERVLKARFLLGLFDSPKDCKFLTIPKSEIDSPAHSQLALEVAKDSMVLLKNDGLLPLDKTKIQRLALIGPNADSVPVLLGNYNGDPSSPVTMLAGFEGEAGPSVEVVYARGCPIAAKVGETLSTETKEFQAAVQLAASSDVVVFAGGIDAKMEGEEMKTVYQGFDRGDRIAIELPAIQTELLKALKATGKPIIFVNFSGSSIGMPWEAENLPAILQAWYPGQNGGTAVAQVVFGQANPSGKLPVTFYRATTDLPPFEDYAMTNRTYRYFNGKPLFPFGHGLSYTMFSYGNLAAKETTVKSDGKVQVAFELKNDGLREGTEVVQLYVKHLESKAPQPIHNLAAFQRVALKPGKKQQVTLEFPSSALRYWDETSNRYVVDPGSFEVQVGSSSADIRAKTTFKID